MSDFLDHPAAIRSGEELDVARLEPFLRSHFPGETGALEVRQFPSGHSNLTYSLHLGTRELVLRRPPFGSKVKSAHDMSREFRVLSKLHSVYAPAPEVLLYCDDTSVIDAPFYVMQPIHGVILRRTLPPGLDFRAETARRLSESFIENLIRLHRVDYAAAGLSDLGKPDGYLERQVRGWTERYYGSKTHDYPEVEKISAWMQEHIPSTSAVSLIHNDYKYDNVVLDSSDITKIVGVLDWEMSTIGDSLSDLGAVLAYWIDATDPEELDQNRWGPTNYPGSFTRDEIVHYYAQKTGRDTSQMAFYLTFARFKLAVIVQQIYYRYHQGLTKDERFAVMPERIQILLRASLRCAQTGRI
ncbi:MAG TPA: phosphotransferase family protein [Candidatus Acidoferrales bacterium]|nr:phosphotransferase family protein [Candidatus Acidoferrales bacterium]